MNYWLVIKGSSEVMRLLNTILWDKIIPTRTFLLQVLWEDMYTMTSKINVWSSRHALFSLWLLYTPRIRTTWIYEVNINTWQATFSRKMLCWDTWACEFSISLPIWNYIPKETAHQINVFLTKFILIAVEISRECFSRYNSLSCSQ